MNTVSTIKNLSKLGLPARWTTTTVTNSGSAPSIVVPNDELYDFGRALDNVAVDESSSYVAAAQFTGSIAATTLTVSAVASGTIKLGQIIQSASITSRPYIQSFITGTGGTGTYQISTVLSIASETMYLTSGIRVPTWARKARISGQIFFPTQASGNGYASLIIVIAGGSPPIDSRTQVPYLTSNASFTEIQTHTAMFNIRAYQGDVINLMGRQTSGASQTSPSTGVPGGGDIWLSAEFFDW